MRSTKAMLSALSLVLVLSLAACDSKEEKQAKYLKRGNDYFEQGAYDKARVEYKNVLRINPSDAEVRYRIGLIDEVRGDVRSAFGNYLASEQQNAHFYPALKKLIQYYLAGGVYEEAQKRSILLLQEQPNDPDSHALEAALLLRQKKYDEAEKEANLALGFDATSVTAYTVLTGLHIARADQAKAAATVEEAIAKNPKNLSLLLLKAMVYEKQDKLDKIAEAYKIIFQIKPDDTRFREDLAKVYLNADKKDDAEKVLRDGVGKNPDNWDMKKRLVNFLNENRGMETAEAEIQKFIKAFPERTDLNFWLADIYILNKATDKAVALLEQLITRSKADEIDKFSLTAQTSLARLQFAKGEKEAAEQLAHHVLSVQPSNPDALFIRSQMLVNQGDYQDAVVALRTIVRDNPKHTEALQLLAEVLLSQGYLDLAVDTMTQLTDAAPSHVPAKIRLAQLLAARGDTDKALSILSFVTKVDPAYSVGWESMARVAIGIKKWDLAQTAIQMLEPIEGQAKTVMFLNAQITEGRDEADQAIQYYKQIIDQDPAAPIAEYALESLGNMLGKQQKHQEFVTYLANIVSPTPLVYSLMGEAFLKLNQGQEAAAAFDKALATDAGLPPAYMGRARLYYAAGKIDQAQTLLQEATKKFPRDQRLGMMQADISAVGGRQDDAVGIYEKLLERNPNNDAAANNAAALIADYMFKDAQRLEKARVLAERFIRSTNPYYLDTLAWVYFRQGKIDQAQTIYERVVLSDQKLPAPVHYHYGVLLVKIGNKEKAKEELQKALADPQGFVDENEAKALLSGL